MVYLRVGLMGLLVVWQPQNFAGDVQTDVYLKAGKPGALPALWAATVAAVNLNNYTRVYHCTVWLLCPNAERKEMGKQKKDKKLFIKVLNAFIIQDVARWLVVNMLLENFLQFQIVKCLNIDYVQVCLTKAEMKPCREVDLEEQDWDLMWTLTCGEVKLLANEFF